jgi:ribosome maturation factor RimP
MSTAADQVSKEAQPLADAAGLDLVDVQVKGAGPRTLVRVIVDRKGGVDLVQCQQLSRDLGDRLDQVDPIPGRYSLEVTSPGVDWPLRTQREFDRVQGRAVRIRRRLTDEQTEEVTGTVAVAEPEAVLIDDKGGSLRIAYDEIVSAKQTLPW